MQRIGVSQRLPHEPGAARSVTPTEHYEIHIMRMKTHVSTENARTDVLVPGNAAASSGAFEAAAVEIT